MNTDRIKAYARMRGQLAPTVRAEEKPPTSAVQSIKIIQHTVKEHAISRQNWDVEKEIWLGFEAPVPVSQILFLDVECVTLGFSPQNIPYLNGLSWFENMSLHCVQIFTESPVFENEGLSVLDEYFLRFQYIVTFNGKSFDIPLLQSRFAYLRKKFPNHFIQHFDLYRQIRRIYPEKPARLLDAESRLLGFERVDDLPGSYSGQAYFEYLRYGKTNLIDQIMRHNLIDIQSLAALAIKIHNAYQNVLQGKDTWAYKIYKDQKEISGKVKILSKKRNKDAEDWRHLGESYAKQKRWKKSYISWKNSYALGNSKAICEALRILGVHLKKKEEALQAIEKFLPKEEAGIQEKLIQLKTRFNK